MMIDTSNECIGRFVRLIDLIVMRFLFVRLTSLLFSQGWHSHPQLQSPRLLHNVVLSQNVGLLYINYLLYHLSEIIPSQMEV